MATCSFEQVCLAILTLLNVPCPIVLPIIQFPIFFLFYSECYQSPSSLYIDIFELQSILILKQIQQIMLQRHPKDKRTFCKIHRIKGVQMGSCLTCPNNAVICEVKGCIGHHEENQRAHNVLTIEQIRHIVCQYMNSTNEKKAYLKKMVYEYFSIARKEVEKLFTQVYDSIDHFVFDDLIFEKDDRHLISLLVEEDYQKFTCDQIGSIIPKLIKSFDFEDGHFIHLRNYLITEKEKVIAKMDMSLLNLPEFRWKNPEDNNYRFYEIYEETLKELNTKLINLAHKPKKLRLKYSKNFIIQLMQALLYEGLSILLLKQTIQGQKMQFVRLLGTLQNLKEIEAVQIYCVYNLLLVSWQVDENEFQLAVVESLLQLPYLRTIAIYTGYEVKSTDFLEELIENRNNIQIKVYKKDWMFL